jgi:hypothetical protein
MFDTELKTISSLTGEAIRHFSIASGLLGIVANIVIGFAFAGAPLTEVGSFLLYRLSWGLGLFSLAFYACGIYALFQKTSLIDQIKRETIEQRVSGSSSN